MRANECRRELGDLVTRYVSIVGMVGLILGLGGLGSRSARAEIQNDAIGFTPNHVFESTDQGEHIDVLSGNMTLAIPLGPRYKLSADFDYGLTLYYNSKLWEYECPDGPPDSDHPCPGTLINGSNYGLGWSLNPGRVYHHVNDKTDVLRVQLADGSEHFFDKGTSASDFTVDSSHMKMLTTSLGGQTVWTAETTDGKRLTFGGILDSSDDGYEALVTRIESIAKRPNGTTPRAWVDYTYSTASGYVRLLTTVEDSQGRTITFSSDSSGITISFPSFVNSNPSACPPQATSDYILRFASIPVHNASDGSYDNPPVSTGVLTRVELPGLSSPSEAYQFEYERTGYYTFGWLLKRTLPTGATVDYYYDVYTTSNWRPLHTELKAKVLTSGGVPYRWTWDRFSIGPAPGLGQPDPHHIPANQKLSGSNPYSVKAVDPFNNLTLYEFKYTQWNSTNHDDCNVKMECINHWTDGLLERVTTFAGPEPDSSRLVRKVEYTWDSDATGSTHMMFQHRAPATAPAPENTHSMAVNARQIEEQTYVPGAEHNYTVKSSQWYPSSYWDPASIVPVQKDEYIDGVLYRSTYTDIAPSDGNWSAHHYVKVTDAAGNVVSRVDRKFTHGQLECEIRRKGTNSSPNLSDCTALNLGDVATINVFDDPPGQDTATGAIIETKALGGDVSTTESRSANKQYQTFVESIDGSTRNSGYLKSTDFGFAWKASDRDIHFGTGLVSRSRDSAGNTTNYCWDRLGRLTSIQPASPEQPTSVIYSDIHTTVVHQDLASGNYVETIYNYDDMGRLIKTKRRNAAGSSDIQRTDYDIAGRVTRKSEWAADGTADANLKWTTTDYTFYEDVDGGRHADPLGRIHSVTTPDDPTPLTPTTEYEYSGDVTTVTVRDVSGYENGADANVTATTKYTKDALGRLIAVDSPGTAAADAAYKYDEMDNLIEARLTDPALPARVQVRGFEYDRLGRLRVASNPENGTIEYTTYDARGNLLSYKDARQKVFANTYDAADRLLTRNQVINGSTFALTANTYDTGTGASGRLVQQDSRRIDNESTSPVSNPVSTIKFGYLAAGSPATCVGVTGGGNSGLNGRLAWQASTIQPWNQELQSTYCYNAMGMPSAVTYPDYSGSGLTRSKVVSSYTNGFLAGVNDVGRSNRSYVTGVTYAPGGVPTQINRPSSNDYIDLDVRNRPSQIRAAGHTLFDPIYTAGCQPHCPELVYDPELGGDMGDIGDQTPAFASWTTGSYSYDMAGNVKQIGDDQYRYDTSSRLTRALQMTSDGMYSMNYAYDAFGSMTGQDKTLGNDSGTTITRTYFMDWHTNRLTQRTATGKPTLNYFYDESGNMVSEGGRVFVYDAPGRLREVLDPETGRLGKYDYDSAGYRVRTEVDGVETFFFRDASGQVLTEFQRPLIGGTTPIWNKDYIYAFGKSWELIRNLKPKTPKRPRVTVRPGYADLSTGLRLVWEPLDAPDILGYSLERVLDGGVAQTFDIPISVGHWDDSYSTAGANTVLTYKLTAMDTAANTSDPSRQLVVYPGTAHAALSPPSGLAVVAGNRKVTLTWSAMAAPALWGYVVYRCDSQGGTFVRLNNVVLASPSFVDVEVLNTHQYWYQIQSVDTAGRGSTLAPTPAPSATPNDSIPPGKLWDVFAEPDRVGDRVIVSWQPGADTDVAWYQIFRRLDDTAPTTDTPVGTVPYVADQSSYSFPDTVPSGGTTYYYSVKAIDAAIPQNVSAASERVSVRARKLVTNPAVITSVASYLYKGGSTSESIDGLPGGQLHGANIDAEDDDIVAAKITFTTGDSAEHDYRIYRKAPTELRFTAVGPSFKVTGSTFDFYDTTIANGNYTYYVTRLFPGGFTESAPASLPTDGSDQFVKHADWSTVRVRNQLVKDGHVLYSSFNMESRLAIVRWSRVDEPELVGYNIYRTCGWWSYEAVAYNFMQHPACEIGWVRLNTVPIPPGTREFYDSTTGGLQGTFLYAVRPVGPNGVEGPIGKIVAPNLDGRGAGNSIENHSVAVEVLPIWTLNGSQSPPADNTPSYWRTVDYVLNQTHPAGSNDAQAINTIVRGTGDASAEVPAPNWVTQNIVERARNGTFEFGQTKFARVQWDMANPPSDLLGFHIEVAGSRNGPWQRLTKHPLAWWERSYVAQGVSVFMYRGGWSSWSGHPNCLNYRVIAVDEDGNESVPAIASNAPTAEACPATPEPPRNLGASSTGGSGAGCTTRLEWDPSPGAIEYHVYRYVFGGLVTHFYDTKTIVGTSTTPPATTYDEHGDDAIAVCSASSVDSCCGYPPGWEAERMCLLGNLEAYYVTAVGPAGVGESPRSNLITWSCADASGGGSWSKLGGPPPVDAIASWEMPPGKESLACWNRPDSARELVIEPNATLSIAPMLRLGTVEPQWGLFDLHTDHLGTVRMISDVYGRMVSKHDYFPFGEEVATQLSYNTHQYTGHERDRETGLDYMLARYYEAGVGRFVQPDPIARSLANAKLPQRWNRYSYTVNNPLRFVDPNGRDLALAVGGATDENGYGHVAIMHNSTVYSAGSAWSGKDGDWGVPAAAYFGTKNPEKGKTQDQSRQTTIIKLKLTPEQEAAVVKDLQRGPGDTGKLSNNCAQRSETALQAGGVLAPRVEVKTTPHGDLGVLKSVMTPEDLQSRAEDEGVAESEEARGTAPDNPASKTTTIVNAVTKKSGS